MKLFLIVVLLIIICGCASKQPYGDYGEYSELRADSNGLNLALDNPYITDKQRLAVLEKYNSGEMVVYRNPAAYSNQSASYRLVVDPIICSNCNYDLDVSQCQEIAANNTRYIANTISNAALGAGIGAAMAAATGLDVGVVASGAAVGGGIAGMRNEGFAVYGMVVRCMQGRGYSVLR